MLTGILAMLATMAAGGVVAALLHRRVVFGTAVGAIVAVSAAFVAEVVRYVRRR